MAITGQNIIDEVRVRYQDYPTANEAADLQWAHDEILRHTKLYPMEATTINVTSGTLEYAYDADAIRIWSAYWEPDSSTLNRDRLQECSIDALDADYESWRTETGTPRYYYDVGGYLGFYPVPNQTTSASYPRVKVWVSKKKTLGLSDSLPGQIDDPEPWIALICYRHATRYYPQDAPARAAVAQAYIEDLKRYVNGVQARLKPSMKVNFPRITNR